MFIRKALIFPFFSIYLLLLSISSKAQQPVDVPNRMYFGGVELRLTESAREKITGYANKLTENARFFRLMVERADAYFPVIEQALAEEQVPDDFKYLSLQESGLVSDVVSTSNAVGFWQFKEATGTEVGLQIDDRMDERMHLYYSTLGAARYVRKNQQLINCWPFALLSYYTGPAGIKQYLKGDEAYASRIEITDQTHWYLLKFLAHKVVFENAVGRNAGTLPLSVALFDECEGLSLNDIAQQTQSSIDDIKLYNKWLKIERIPTDRNYLAIIPAKADVVYVAKVENIPPADLKPYKESTFEKIFGGHKNKPTETSEQPIFFSWNGIKAIQARKGDNINKLAIQGGISREDFLKFNDLRIFDRIEPGQVYYLKPKRNRSRSPFHVVQYNESLWQISQRYGIKISSILDKNQIKGSPKLEPGRVLYLRNNRPDGEPIRYEKVSPPPTPEPTIPNKPITQETKTAHKPQPDTLIVPKTKPETSVVEKTDTIKTNTIVKPDTSNAYAIPPYKQSEEVVNGFLIHRIAPGETLYGISRLYGTPIDSIKAFNLWTSASITLGQKIKVKRSELKTVTTPNRTPTIRKNLHVVSAGQTLFGISRTYSVSSDSILKWNQMQSPQLSVGDTLIVYSSKMVEPDGYVQPDKPTNIEPIAGPKDEPHFYHTVKLGETMFSIARMYNVTLRNLLDWNKKTDTSISVGQQLLIVQPKD